MSQINQQPNNHNSNSTQPVGYNANPRHKGYLNPKLAFAILGICLLAAGGFFVWQNYFFKQNDLVQCSSGQIISQIIEQIRAGSTADMIEKGGLNIIGFYIDK